MRHKPRENPESQRIIRPLARRASQVETSTPGSGAGRTGGTLKVRAVAAEKPARRGAAGACAGHTAPLRIPNFTAGTTTSVMESDAKAALWENDV